MDVRVRLLLISSAFPPMQAPEAAHATALAERLAAAGIEVHVLTSREAKAGSGQIKYAVYPAMSGWGWRDLPTLATVARRVQPDTVLLVYVSWLYGHHPMVTWLPKIWSVVAGCSVRFISQFEATARTDGRWFHLQKRLLQWWPGLRRYSPAWGALLSDSDTIITLCNPHLAELCIANTSVTRKGVMIPVPPLLSIDSAPLDWTPARTRTALDIPADAFVLIFFGYVYRGKGVETLIRAIRLAASELPSITLIVIGKVTEAEYGRELASLAESEGIGERIRWIGQQPDSAVSAGLRAADVCVLPFDAGVALNNSSVSAAAAHGTAFISTTRDDLEEAFGDERLVLVRPRDPASLAAVMVLLATNPGRLAAARIAALELAARWFSWDHAIQLTCAVLRGENLP